MKTQFKKETSGFEWVYLSPELEVKPRMSWEGERQPCCCNLLSPVPLTVRGCVGQEELVSKEAVVLRLSVSDGRRTALPNS